MGQDYTSKNGKFRPKEEREALQREDEKLKSKTTRKGRPKTKGIVDVYKADNPTSPIFSENGKTDAEKIREFFIRSQTDIVYFVETLFKNHNVKVRQWQRDVLEDFHNKKKTAIVSANGIGKSTLLSWIILHHLLVYPEIVIILTAPTFKQLQKGAWAELERWYDKLPDDIRPLLIKNQDVLKRAGSETNFCAPITVRQDGTSEAFQGFHSKFIMFIGDEATGIPEHIYTAAIGVLTDKNSKMLLTSNPMRTFGYFYNVFDKDLDDWNKYQISALDVEEVDMGFVKEIEQQFGADSFEYTAKVLGQFDDRNSTGMNVFKRIWIDDAARRNIDIDPNDRIYWGIDVAAHGEDSSVICERTSNVLYHMEKVEHQGDTPTLSKIILDKYKMAEHKPTQINVDNCGLGLTFTQFLRQLFVDNGIASTTIVNVNVAEKPSDNVKYDKLKAELYFRSAEWLRENKILLTESQLNPLRNEMLMTEYLIKDTNNKIAIEKKDAIRKKLGRSPDHLEAFILTFLETNLNPVTMLNRGTGQRKERSRIIKNRLRYG